MINKLKMIKEIIVIFTVLCSIILSFSCTINIDINNDSKEKNSAVNSKETPGKNKIESLEEFPEEYIPGEKKNVDLLVLLYMDGDNNLESLIWEDLQEAIEGIKLHGDNEKTEVIALWDGNKFGDSALFKLDKKENKISLNKTANWLYTRNKYSDIVPEVNMNEGITLENYLKWAKNNYNFNNVILQLSDHGAGPGEMEPKNQNERAMCQDENVNASGNQLKLLGTKDVPIAIENSGIGKIDIVIQDVCFGSSIEEAYEYKDVADYMLLSPNLMPGNGLNYKKLIGHLRSGTGDYDCIENGSLNIEKYLNVSVCDFIDSYKIPQMKWEKLLEYYKNNELKGMPLELYVSLEAIKRKDIIIPTISVIKLEKIEELKCAIDNLVSSIPRRSVYLKQFLKMFYNMNNYSAPLSTLYDIGYICDEIKSMENPNPFDSLKWKDIQNQADSVKKALDNVILFSWRDGYGGALYNKSGRKDLTGILPFNNGSYGLAVSSLGYKDNYAYIPDTAQYKGYLKFGKESMWYDFIYDVLYRN